MSAAESLPFPAADLCVRNVIDWYLAQPGALGTSAESAAERHRILNLFVASYGGEAMLACRPYMLDDFVNAQPRVKKQNTRKRWFGTVLCCFNYATQRGRIERNPFRGPRIPAGDEGRDLTDLEFKAILRLAWPEYRRALIFLRETGCRPAELRAATVGQVDLGNRRIVQAQHKTRAKTRKPRYIYLTVAALKLVKWLIPRAGPDGHLFLNSDRRPWQNSAMTKAFLRLRRRCGISDDAKQYGCRHALLTELLCKGESPALVAELAGHSGTQTLRRYTHLTDKKVYLIEALDRAKSPR